MPDAENMLIDKAHRVGIQKPNTTRRIEAKFHYYGQKETVKSKSYYRSGQLKQANLGIGMQWPQQIRDCVIPCAFFGKSVKHAFSCRKMCPVEEKRCLQFFFGVLTSQ